jgi:carbon storage regulator
MLVLTRRIGEEIVIGGNIHVSVVAIQGNKVRIAIRAPEAVTVDRLEIHQRRRSFGAEPACLEGAVARS